MVSAVAFAPGTLERTPLFCLLASILDRQLTGTLVLETPAGDKSALGFLKGDLKKVKTAEPVARLGALLVQHGFFDPETCETSYADAKGAGRLHGDHLLQSGMVDAAALERALRTQLLLKLKWVADLPPSTAYGFYDGQDFLARWAGPGVRVSPLLAIWYLVRASQHLPNFSERLALYASQPFALARAAQTTAFGFGAAEHSLLQAMAHSPQTLVGLRRLNHVPEAALERFIYVLSFTRHLELQGEGEHQAPLGLASTVLDCTELLDSQPPRALSAAPASLGKNIEPSSPVAHSTASEPVSRDANDAELSERRRLIRDLASRYETLDYYELLGIASDATAAQIQAAFLEAAKRYHPDKLGTDLSDLRVVSAKLFARITEARQTLSDPNLRRQYDAKVSRRSSQELNGDDEQQRIHEIVGAATSFQKAEVFLKKRMFREAEQEARRAHEADPEQADYLALLAWINANKPDSAAALPEVLAQLNAAVRMSPEDEKARFYRAQVLTRLGRNQEAVADYKFVVGKNPHNIDAQRELRLWDMRQKKIQTGGFGTRESPGRISQNFIEGFGQSRPAPGHSTPAPGSARQNPASSKGSVFSKLFKK